MCTENPAPRGRRAPGGVLGTTSCSPLATRTTWDPPGNTASKSQRPDSSKGLCKHRSPCRGEGREPACGSTPGPAGKGAQMGDQRGVKLADPLHGRLPPLPTGREGVAGRPVGSVGSGVPREQPCPGCTCGGSEEVLLPTGLPPSLRLHHCQTWGPLGGWVSPGRAAETSTQTPGGKGWGGGTPAAPAELQQADPGAGGQQGAAQARREARQAPPAGLSLSRRGAHGKQWWARLRCTA